MFNHQRRRQEVSLATLLIAKMVAADVLPISSVEDDFGELTASAEPEYEPPSRRAAASRKTSQDTSEVPVRTGPAGRRKQRVWEGVGVDLGGVFREAGLRKNPAYFETSGFCESPFSHHGNRCW